MLENNRRRIDFCFAWSEHIAVDESGRVWEFTHTPEIHNGIWCAAEGYATPTVQIPARLWYLLKFSRFQLN